MRELARGDANESQAPRGCRRHLTAGAPPGGRGRGETEQQQVAIAHASYLFWPESRAARADVSIFFPPPRGDSLRRDLFMEWGATLSGCIS